MDARTLSIRTIFGQDRQHQVPLFQRPYVWQRSEQWEPMWEDIRSVAERLLGRHPTRPHFLGAIVLDQLRQPSGYLEVRLVIDGQQRLTTIQLLLEAFCDLCDQMSVDKYHRALLRLTRNDNPLSDVPDEEFKVWPTNVDQATFRQVMRAGSPEEVYRLYGVEPSLRRVGHPIADAYLFFYDSIEAWMSLDEERKEKRIESLYKTVLEYVRMVVIDLDKEDDAQLIFETLNARGTPLLPSDLVKNFLFHQAYLDGARLETLYSEHWQPFDQNFEYWRKELGKGHAQRIEDGCFTRLET